MTKPERGFQLTVQGWQNLVLGIMGVLVLAGALTGAVLLNRTDNVSRGLIDDIQPARVAAYQLQAALRDQETATRGYAISADRQFLDPYYEGQQAEKRRLRTPSGSGSATAPTCSPTWTRSSRRRRAWRASFAEPLIASIKPGAPGVVDGATVDRGKTEFDGIRLLFDVQNQHLDAARTAGLAELDAVRDWRDRVLIAMVATFFLMAVVLALLVRGAITRPLAALAASCRRITEGNFGERIVPQGPKDIRRIATDVENMRQRIVADLDVGARAPARNWTSRPSNCGGRTPNSSSSPTSHPTICRSRCARWRRSASCSRSATATNSTSAASSTSASPSTAPSACRC